MKDDGITSTAFGHEERRALLGIDRDTFQALRDAGDLLRDNADDAVDSFYARLADVPSLSRLIERNSSIDALRGTLRRYLLDFSSTDLGEGHIASRRRIAVVHERLGVPIDAYQAQLQALREAWTGVVLRAYRKRPPEDALRLIVALDKVMTFDEGIVARYFTDALTDALELARAEDEPRAVLQRELGDLAGQLAASAQQSLASTEQMTASAATMADQLAGASELASEARDAAASGADAMTRAGQAVTDVTSSNRDVRESAGVLEARSSDIEGISRVLKETVDQINLLALNAAIEAARAGDAGRGFAVVADEVRKLAEATQRHLEGTGTALAAMLKAIADVRAAGARADGVADVLSENADTVGDHLERIAGSVSSTDEVLQGIVAASQEVASAAGETSRGSAEVATLAERLQELAVGLNVGDRG